MNAYNRKPQKGDQGELKVIVLEVNDDGIKYILYHGCDYKLYDHKRPTKCKYRFDKFTPGYAYHILTEKRYNAWKWYFVDHQNIQMPNDTMARVTEALKLIEETK